MSKFKKASIASIVFVLLIISFTIASFAVNSATITKEAKLRKTASDDSTVLEIIPESEEVEVLSQDGEWYQVKYNKIKGYVQSEFLEIIEDANVSNDTTTQKIQEEIQVGNTITLNSPKKLYIRPLINSKVIATIEQGATITVEEINNNWIYINSDNGYGWVRIEDTTNSITKSNTEETETTDSTEQTNNEESSTENSEDTYLNKTAYITSTGINFRTEPNTDSEIIMVFAQNAKITILEEVGDWYKIKHDEDIGYVVKTYVSEKKVETTSRSGNDREQTTTTQETQVEENTTKTEVSTLTETTTNSEDTTTTTTTTSSSKGKEVAEYVKQFVGCKYVYGGSTPSGFDCSGLTMYVYNKFGISLSHSATAQSKVGTKVSKSDLQPGDLVFFTNYKTNQGIRSCRNLHR